MDTTTREREMAQTEHHIESEVMEVKTDLRNFKDEMRRDVGDMKESIQRIVTALNSLADRVSGQGRVDWKTITGIIALFLTASGLMGSVGYGFTMLINRNATEQLQLRSDFTKELSALQHAHLREMLTEHKASPGHSGSSERITAIEKQLEEIETQFRAMSQTVNLQNQDQERWLRMLWEKTHGSPLPAQTYFPEHGKDYLER